MRTYQMCWCWHCRVGVCPLLLKLPKRYRFRCMSFSCANKGFQAAKNWQWVPLRLEEYESSTRMWYVHCISLRIRLRLWQAENCRSLSDVIASIAIIYLYQMLATVSLFSSMMV